MAILALLHEAHDAGLTVRVVEGELLIRGPRRLGGLAHRLLSQKRAVIDVLEAEGRWHGGLNSAHPDASPATDEQLRLWLDILRERGVQFTIVDGDPVPVWPMALDSPGRRYDWERHRDRLARIIREN
jgi:hypothetical protein